MGYWRRMILLTGPRVKARRTSSHAYAEPLTTALFHSKEIDYKNRFYSLLDLSLMYIWYEVFPLYYESLVFLHGDWDRINGPRCQFYPTGTGRTKGLKTAGKKKNLTNLNLIVELAKTPSKANGLSLPLHKGTGSHAPSCAVYLVSWSSEKWVY